MAWLHAEHALTPAGWQSGVRIGIGAGRIAALQTNRTPVSGDERHGVLVPAPGNLHSHAFQHAMAGLAERRGAGSDSFWTWRALMYRFALGMTPGDVEAVAGLLYARMLEAGFARVGEFHYLHHDHDGGHYADIGEMSARIAAASEAAGISLTLLPVFYAHSGFGAAIPDPQQRRFVSSPDDFARLHERSGQIVGGLEGGVLGVAPHSLRAATVDEIRHVLTLSPGGPVHIHVAEQVAEIEACRQIYGASPVRLLLDNVPVNARWCLIHATHMTPDEISDMAMQGAVAGLCPITEANLGDGIFPGAEFRRAGGAFGVGSDSNVSVSLPGELRQYEYSQRLRLRVRNAIADAGASSGRTLFDGALAGGAQALGALPELPGLGGLAAGNWADLVSLEGRAARYLMPDELLDSWIFGDGVAVDCVWARGRKQVEGGRHVRREALTDAFHHVMHRLVTG